MDSGVDVGPFRIDEERPLTRDYFVTIVDRCESDESLTSFITFLSTLDGDSLEAALPSLCDFALKCPQTLFCELEIILLATLSDHSSTRGGRKACYSCLKILKSGQTDWSDFFVVAESLEEPQFHIICPVLPRVDGILKQVSAGLFPWKWATIIFIRALLHSNGWIRLWALEKSAEVDPQVLAKDSNFLTSWILPSLNGNDLFWRLLERNRLDSFVGSLGRLLHEIVSILEPSDSSSFLKNILISVESLSCPFSFYFVAVVLQHIHRKNILIDDDGDLLPLCRRVLNRVQYMQYPSLKMATSYLIVNFLANAVCWTTELMMEFSSLTVIFSGDSTGLLKRISETLKTSWATIVKKNMLTADTLLDEIMNVNNQDPDFYRFLWLRAELAGVTSLLHSKLCLSITEIEGDSQLSLDTASLLSALLYSPEAVDKDIVHDVVGNILLKVAVMEGKPSDFCILRLLYFPLLKKFAPEATIRLLEAVSPHAFSKDIVLPTERMALLSVIAKQIADGWRGDIANFYPVVVKYIGNDLLTSTHCKKTLGLSAKEFAVILGDMMAARVDLYLRFIPLTTLSAESGIEECISQLDCASSYTFKDRLLTVIEKRIHEVSDSSLKLSALNAAAAVVNEEKKSQNCLPSISKLLKIGMQKNMLSDSTVSKRVKELFAEFTNTANLSLSIALILAHALESAQLYLPADWAKETMCIAIFGPVPKKDTRVLSAAYAEIYNGELSDSLPTSEFERLHEVVQRARMRSFSVAVRCSKENSTFCASVVKEILEESTALDKSSSKSFGLSLAHRQKTRVVSLLFFVMEYVVDPTIICSVYEHCLECILDPCQQFSIKLVVEWILVRLCLKHNDFKNKLISAEKTLAAKRIGSVSSWINTMVHICRVEQSEDILGRMISVLVPWTSAQNFAVRCTAIAGLKLMYSLLPASSQEKYSLVKGIVDFDSEPAGNSRRIIENLTSDFYFAFLNMADHVNLQTVLIELPSKTGLPQEETIPLSLIDELNTTEFPSRNTDERFLAAPSLVYAALSKNASCAPDIEIERDETEEEQQQPETSFQKKIVTKERVKKDDCSIIVVASLIDKPNNLGGLCRTSEIFGVETLVLADMLMANDTGFKALSMSSEKWQHIEAVRPDQLLPYLEKLRQNGYTVIAAEQTTDSVCLHQFKFPKKCALLMGDEKEGVPTRLLRAVDQTVEIEQLGQTRSLNVHVTAALFIAKYAEQVLL